MNKCLAMVTIKISLVSQSKNFATVLHPNSASPKPGKWRRAMLIIFVMKQCCSKSTVEHNPLFHRVSPCGSAVRLIIKVLRLELIKLYYIKLHPLLLYEVHFTDLDKVQKVRLTGQQRLRMTVMTVSKMTRNLQSYSKAGSFPLGFHGEIPTSVLKEALDFALKQIIPTIYGFKHID